MCTFGNKLHAYLLEILVEVGQQSGKLKVKIKFTLEQAMKAQRWNRGIALLLF